MQPEALLLGHARPVATDDGASPKRPEVWELSACRWATLHPSYSEIVKG